MKWRAADFIVIAVVLLCAFAIWLYPFLSSEGTSAKIEHAGKSQSVSLAENRIIELENATVKVENGEIFIEEAQCPDSVCIKTGKISREGESIICVPNQIVITIEGDSSVDAVAN